jgi:outer membrane protein assembly factor BamB
VSAAITLSGEPPAIRSKSEIRMSKSETLQRVLPCLAVSYLVTALGGWCIGADEWPGFRGPAGDGHADTARLPIEWSASQNVTWQTPIHGLAWSSPVVSGNDVWLTTATEEGKELSVLCLDLTSGQVRIDRKVFDVQNPPDIRKYNTYASPTPVIHGGRLYASWGSAGLACLDTETGETLWERRDLPCDHYRGAGSSPIIHNGKLYLHYDGYDFQYVVALDIATGATIWRTDRPRNFHTDNGDIKKAFATPLVINVGGREQLISPTSKGTFSYDPETGDEIWRINYAGFSTAARPLFAHGLVYLSAGFPRSEIIAVRPDGQGDVTDSHIGWSEKKLMPSKPSPLLVGDLMFTICDDGGVATCLDAHTGEKLWQERIGGNYSASPIYADGQVYFFCEDGRTTVIRAARELELLAENQLGAGVLASPAVVGDSLLLRTSSHLYRLDDARP